MPKSNVSKKKFVSLLICMVMLLSPLTFKGKVGTVNLIQNKSVKSSTITRDPIIIDDSGAGWPPMSYTWEEAVLEDWCSGSGSANAPYIIQNLRINAEGEISCLIVRNSNSHFIIQNCEFFGVYGAAWYTSALYLESTNNGRISNVKCSNNYGSGIGLYENCQNIIISGNFLNNNSKRGIQISDCINILVSDNDLSECYIGINCINNLNVTVENNVATTNSKGLSISESENIIVINNIASGNYDNGIVMGLCTNTCVSNNNVESNNVGIELQNSDYNNVTENEVHYNQIGLSIWDSNNNRIVDNNLINNDQCIKEINCQGNIFINNDCKADKTGAESTIPGFSTILILITIVSINIIIIMMKRKINKIKVLYDNLDILT